MSQNALLRITRSSHSPSTTYRRILHPGRFMDELFKRCEHLKLPLVIINTAADRNHPFLHLTILEADLHLLMLF